MFYTVTINTNPNDEKETVQSCTSSVLSGAVAGAAAAVCQYLDMYASGSFIAPTELSEMLEICDANEWELRLLATAN